MQENLQLSDGTNIYITDGRLHREDGQALQTSGRHKLLLHRRGIAL